MIIGGYVFDCNQIIYDKCELVFKIDGALITPDDIKWEPVNENRIEFSIRYKFQFSDDYEWIKNTLSDGCEIGVYYEEN